MSVKLITPDTDPKIRVRRTVKGKTRTRFYRINGCFGKRLEQLWQAAYNLDEQWKSEQEREHDCPHQALQPTG